MNEVTLKREQRLVNGILATGWAGEVSCARYQVSGFPDLSMLMLLLLIILLLRAFVVKSVFICRLKVLGEIFFTLN